MSDDFSEYMESRETTDYVPTTRAVRAIHVWGVSGHDLYYKKSNNSVKMCCSCGWRTLWRSPDAAIKEGADHVGEGVWACLG